MPKKPTRKSPILSPVSAETKDSLANLHAKIDLAEKLLKKMPGARRDDVRVSLHKLYPEDDMHGYESYLEFWGDGLRHVSYSPAALMNEAPPKTERLEDLPALSRIQVSAFIPDLIALAKKAEGSVRAEADDVAASIEQAIAEATEE